MEIKINDAKYPLHFGWAFLKYINSKRGLTSEGVSIGTGGMLALTAGAEMRDPEMLKDIIKGATETDSNKPSDRDIEAYIEQLIVDDKFLPVYDEIYSEIKKQPVLMQAAAGNQVVAKVSKA
ncbi:tail assembly chaperone [Streptococcus sp. H31]|uniref:tail assembly chaperone n=1 Tax=Streptococcus huangxiaojuni TaxID=3237239 RepID=UPI0034A2EC04